MTRRRAGVVMVTFALILASVGGVVSASSTGVAVLGWFSSDGGGVASSTNGLHDIAVTIGQHDASTMIASTGHSATGGFWGGVIEAHEAQW